MYKLKLYILLALLILPSDQAPDTSTGYVAFVPSVIHTIRPAGFDMWPGAPAGLAQEAINLHNILYIRIGWGSDIDNFDTPYQHYLNGGWPAVDTEVLTDLNAIRNAGLVPIPIMTYGGTCTSNTNQQLTNYGNFVADFADRYEIEIIDPWNEPDATYQVGGMPSLFGCGPLANNMILLLNVIKSNTDAEVMVSFMFNDADKGTYMKKVAPHAELVGIHYYGIYVESTGQVLYPWSGTPQEAFDLGTQYAGQQVWFTEYNLRNSTYNCTNTDFLEKQFDFLVDVSRVRAPVLIPFTYLDNPAWECTGLRQQPPGYFNAYP